MSSNTTVKKVAYNDVLFFLVVIPFINALNYYLTYSYIDFSIHTLFTFLIDTFEGYAAWWGIRSVVTYLDKKMLYEAAPLKRIVVQLSASSAFGLLIIIIMTELVNKVAKPTPVPASFYRYDIFIFLIWFFVLNGIYVGLHYYRALKNLEMLRNEDKKIRTEGFLVKDGRLNLTVAFNDVAIFFTEGDYTALVTTSAKKYLLDRSLDKIEQSLPKELFFRLNRQYIAHRNAIQGFKKVENGKLDIILLGQVTQPIQVSRTKAPDFKAWFQPE